MYRWRNGRSNVYRKKMKLNKNFFKPRKNLKNRVIKKMPFTVRGYQYYYGAIIVIVLLIGFSQVFS